MSIQLTHIANDMKTDYKFWYIRRDDDVHISECAVRFYEGEITTENERDVNGNLVPITRYRRTKKLKKFNLPHFKGRKIIKDLLGNKCQFYTQEDFGIIKTDDELRLFLNKELAKDKSRIPIFEQV